LPFIVAGPSYQYLGFGRGDTVEYRYTLLLFILAEPPHEESRNRGNGWFF